MGLFNSNMMTNPQMGNTQPNNSGAGGFGSLWQPGQTFNPSTNQDWYNPNSPMSQWQGGFAPDAAAWTNGTPGHAGQDFTYNSQTGETGWMDTPGTGFFSGTRKGGGGADMVSWTDPVTGDQIYNPGAIMNMLGMNQSSSGGGDIGYTPELFQGGGYTVPDAYGGYEFDLQTVDPSEAIAAQEYKLAEAMDQDFGKAGMRAGQSGWGMSTGYTGDLGDAARRSSQDRNALTMQYQYDAAKFNQQQELAMQMQQAQADLAAWQTQGGWDVGLQGLQMGNDLSAWQSNQQNLFNTANANMQNQQYGQSMNAQLLAQILGGMF